MGKLLYRSQTVSGSGELLEEKSVYVSRHREEFVMIRLTDGVGWLGQFRTVVHLKSFIWLSSRMDEDNVVEYGGDGRRLLAAALGCAESTTYSVISGLVRIGMMRKLSRGRYMINPSVCFRTNVTKLGRLVTKYAED